MILPPPEHPLGYTDRELRTFMTAEEFTAFQRWMQGQTITDNGRGEFVSYTHDVEVFLDGVRRRGRPPAILD